MTLRVPDGVRLQAALLRRRDFGLIWWGGFISKIGDGLTFFALAWLFAERDDPAGLAITLIAYEVAAIAGGLALTGVMDRFSRRRIMVLDSLVRAAAVAVVPAVGIWHEPGLWTIAPAMAVLGAWSPAADVGMRALTVDLVETHELNAANGLEGAQWAVGWLLGPLMGGILVATAGTLTAFWVDAATYLAFAVLLMLASGATDRIPARAEHTSYLQDLKGGIDYVRREPLMLVIVQLTGGANLVGGMLAIALPFLVIEQGGGPVALAVIETIAGAGGLVGSLLAASLRWTAPATVSLSWVAVLLAVPSAVIALRPPLWAIAALTALANLAIAPWNVLLLTLRQRVVPSDLLGRVLSLTMLLNRAGNPAGQSIGGPLVAVAGPAVTYGVAAAGQAMSGILSFPVKRWRTFPLRLTDPESPPGPSSRGGAGGVEDQVA